MTGVRPCIFTSSFTLPVMHLSFYSRPMPSTLFPRSANGDSDCPFVPLYHCLHHFPFFFLSCLTAKGHWLKGHLVFPALSVDWCGNETGPFCLGAMLGLFFSVFHWYQLVKTWSLNFLKKRSRRVRIKFYSRIWLEAFLMRKEPWRPRTRA